MFKLLMKFDYNFSWPAFQVRAAVPHDVQRRAVHGDDVQFGVQREAARGHGLPGLGVIRSRSDCRETKESFITNRKMKVHFSARYLFSIK